MTPDVEFRGVTKTYGNTIALDRVSLSVQRGEFLTLLGPSGCGKTTLLRMLAGFLEPTAGEIRIGGKPVAGIPPYRRNVGLVFQNYALFPHMSVFENVAFGLRRRGMSGTQLGARVGEVLTLVNLAGYAKRLPRELSGGEQQRVAIARAIAIRPSVLLFDEPLSNLDAKLREIMQVELKQIQREVGVTTIFVTHNQDEALALSDRVAVLSRGQVEQVGTPSEIYVNPRSRFVADFIGRSNILRGRVESWSGEKGIVSTESGLRVEVCSGPSHPIGSTIVIAIRAECVELVGAESPLGNKFDGVVESSVYLGAFTELVVRVGQTGLIARRLNRIGDFGPVAGQSVSLGWKPSAGVILTV